MYSMCVSVCIHADMYVNTGSIQNSSTIHIFVVVQAMVSLMYREIVIVVFKSEGKVLHICETFLLFFLPFFLISGEIPCGAKTFIYLNMTHINENI